MRRSALDIRKKDRKGGEQLCPKTVRTGAAAEKAGPAVSVRTAPAAGCRSQVRGKDTGKDPGLRHNGVRENKEEVGRLALALEKTDDRGWCSDWIRGSRGRVCGQESRIEKNKNR